MKKIILFCLTLACTTVRSQDVNILFSTDDPITIYLFEPLDNAYNSRYATDTIYLKPNLKVEYQIPVNDFKYIQIKTSLFSRYVLPLTSGDRLTLNFKGKDLSISGDNADGLIYYNNRFISEGIAEYSEKINGVFVRLVNSLPFSELSKECLNEIMAEVSPDMNDMLNSGRINQRFFEIVDTDITYAFNERIINEYLILAKNRPQDSLEIRQAIDELFQSYPADIPDILLYNFTPLYVSRYYSRQPYTKNEDFQSYSYYLASPPEILLASMGNAFLIDIQYGFKSFNYEKVYSYLASHFPASDYVRILGPMFESSENSQTNNTPEEINFITSEVSRLEDLSRLEPFKNNYLLIDLWATWCIPCRAEFQYAPTVHEIMGLHSNLQLLYLSIDEDRFENHWENTVANLNLKGYHLRVTQKELYEDIVKNVYADGPVTIPRYILLNPEGKIVNSDLPRPSSGEVFKKAIEVLVTE